MYVQYSLDRVPMVTEFHLEYWPRNIFCITYLCTLKYVGIFYLFCELIWEEAIDTSSNFNNHLEGVSKKSRIG